MTSNLLLRDNIIASDKHNILKESGLPKGTNIFFIDDETGKPYRIEHNRVTIAGAQFTACKHFGIDPIVDFPNYNTSLGISNMILAPSKAIPEYAVLFCCGTSGCGIEGSQVYPVTYHNWIHPDSLIPFRYEDIGADLSAEQRKIYFGRKEVPEERKVAYYYKAFDSQPQIYMSFLDGTQIDSDVYTINTKQQATTMVQVRLKVTKSDFRDWFFSTEGIENARINTLSLLTAWPYTDPVTGYIYYNNVRPLTQLNFTNEWLIDLTKSITIVYQILY